MLLDAPIHSDRLLLRTLTPEDIGDRYLSWINDPDVFQYLEVRFTEQTIGSLRDSVSQFNDSEDNLFLGIFIKEDGTHIGNIKLGPINPHHQSAPIGIIIGDRNHWGKAYATETIQALTEYAFRALNIHKLFAGCYSSNEGSRRAFLKVGFEEEGRLREYWLCDGERQDEILLGLVNPS